MTAIANSTTSRLVERRATSWCSKKSTAARVSRRGRGWRPPPTSPPSSELHFHRATLLVALGGLQQFRRREREHAGDDVRGELLRRRVVAHHGVVEGLAGERDLVLGARQFFGELHH